MNKRRRSASPTPTHLALSSADDFGAIAVDTNIYQEYGFRFRSQPLLEVPQVKALGIKWLVPEVWELEILRHLKENTGKVVSLRRDLQKVHEWGTPAEVELAKKLMTALTDESGDAVAERLLLEHFGAGRPLKLRTAWESGPAVLQAYFGGRAPFEAAGDKKNEFPDAFALATLQVWARENRTKVAVVTRDQGCLRACQATEVLRGYASLTEALAALRKAETGRRSVIEEYEKLLAHELSDDTSELRRGIDAVVRERVPDLELEVEFQEEAGQDCDHEVTYVNVDGIAPWKTADGAVRVRVFTATQGQLSFVWELEVEVDVEAKFARWSSRGGRSYIDEAVPEMTSGSLQLEAIVTLQPSGSLSASTIPHASVRRVELKLRDVNVDFGTIQAWEPSYEE